MTSDQKNKLRLMIVEKTPNWKISYWLVKCCGLDFMQAMEERLIEENKIKAEKKEKSYYQQKKEEVKLKEEVKEECISCGQFECDCEVKKVCDIPFN